jgi:hypothetical protein
MIDPKLEVGKYELGNNNKVTYDGVLLSRNSFESVPDDCFLAKPERISEIEKMANVFQSVGGGRYRILVEGGTTGVCEEQGFQEASE